MTKTNILKTTFLVAFSLISTYLIITFRYFPHLGLFIFFTSLALITFKYKKSKTTVDYLLTGTIIILSFCLFYWAPTVTTLLNVVAILYLGAILALRNTNTFNFSLIETLLAPIQIVLETIVTKNTFINRIDQENDENIKLSKEQRSEIVTGSIISIIVLAVIVPLLASANPIFNSWLDFNIPDLIVDFFNDGGIVKVIFFSVLMFFIPRYLIRTRIEKRQIIEKIDKDKGFENLIPKVVTIVVLFLFFISQIQLYFASTEYLEAIGYSNSRQTNEVFYQLAVVILVILGLVYKDRSKRLKHAIATYILAAQGIFLTFIAVNSDVTYIQNWGLTYKRLYGLFIIAWVVGMLIAGVGEYVKELKNNEFIKFSVLYTAFLLILVNISNFDYLIFHYSKSTTHIGTDYLYMSKLSSNARSYVEMVETLKPELQNIVESENLEYSEQTANNLYALEVVNQNIVDLRRKYESNEYDFRMFNYSEYKEYKRTKEIDTEEVKELLDKYYQLEWQQYQQNTLVIKEEVEKSEEIDYGNSSVSNDIEIQQYPN